MPSSKGLAFSLILAALLASALAVRTISAGHGLPYIYNYDEPATAGAALNILKTGDFNPHTFAYGTSLTYLYVIVDVINFLRLMGKPASAATNSYLTSLSDIHVGVVGSDTEWLWTISHPSFYFCDRMASVFLSLSAIIMTYHLTQIVIGSRWSALVSVAVLAGLGISIEHSAYTTPDGAVTCYVVGAVLFASLFQVNGQKRYFLWSLVMTGLAAATKYNSALVIVVPTTALIMQRYRDPKSIDLHWFLCLFLLPIAIFIVIMPYSLLTLLRF